MDFDIDISSLPTPSYIVDDKEMLEDMIMIAIKDAFSKIDKESETKLGSYASMSGLF